MSFARTHSCVTVAVDGYPIEVETHVSAGLVGMNVTGLADTAINESRERVRAALMTIGHEWPQKRITVGLSPAWLPKHGSGLDVAIAIGIFAAEKTVSPEVIAQTMFYGELGLDGRVRGVAGTLIAAMTARKMGLKSIVVASSMVSQARLVEGITVIGVRTLTDAIAVAQGQLIDDFDDIEEFTWQDSAEEALDYAQVIGQQQAKRGLEVAAAGAHNIAFVGSPGVGKTLLAQRLPSILPPLDRDSALEVAAISSVSRGGVMSLSQQPPFAAPHHTASYTSMIGGGSGVPVIGLVTQAHRGVLFLDEAPEFASNVLEALRQPLESGEVHLTRKSFSISMPARFQLVLAMNPCPCGMKLEKSSGCGCTPFAMKKYALKMSGPLMDRVDIRLELEKPRLLDFDGLGSPAESSADMRERVVEARSRQSRRLVGTPWRTNAEVPGSALRELFPLARDAHAALMAQLVSSTASGRAVDRVTRVMWTLSDLAGRSTPAEEDAVVAASLRGITGVFA